MPKKEKTKKQKILADKRLISNPIKIDQADFTSYSLPKSKPSGKLYSISNDPDLSSELKKSNQISVINYDYLSGDLRKTLLLTGVIIVAELIIKFVELNLK